MVVIINFELWVTENRGLKTIGKMSVNRTEQILEEWFIWFLVSQQLIVRQIAIKTSSKGLALITKKVWLLGEK